VTRGSDFRYDDFVSKYNTEIIDGHMKGLSARAVLVIIRDNTIQNAELVPEISREPYHDCALEAVKKLILIQKIWK
jgi:thiol peroxidase